MALSKRQVKGAIVSAMEAHLENWKAQDISIFEDVRGDRLVPAVQFHTYEDPDSTDKAFVVSLLAVSSNETLSRQLVESLQRQLDKLAGRA